MRGRSHRRSRRELGDWLAYERAEPEWTVDAWLRGAPEVPHNVRHDEIAQLDNDPNYPEHGKLEIQVKGGR